MKTLEDKFVPFDLALRLKNLGFDEECLAYFEDKRVSFGFDDASSASIVYMKNSPSTLSAPLYQEAFDWFREEHGLDSYIKPDWILSSKQGYDYVIDCNDGITESETFSTYPEARLSCLTKLIEIVEQKQK